jgi:hypothetical protein
MIAKKAAARLTFNFLISLKRFEKWGIVISIVTQFFQVAGILIRFIKSFQIGTNFLTVSRTLGK